MCRCEDSYSCPHYQPERIVFVSRSCKKQKSYGLLNFLFDIIMLVLTGGLWIIWIFVREMRRN